MDIKELLSGDITDPRRLLKIIGALAGAAHYETDPERMKEGVGLISRITEPPGTLGLAPEITRYLEASEWSKLD